MAVYRKRLVDKDGNTIIPAVGDIYGTVYTATLSSATAGGAAKYDFTPDTPVENNRVYAVKFPTPTVNNATVILGDGVSSGSILVPPVSATDSPNYELLNTDMINNTEPLLLMYNGVQWVCLNQKKKVDTADLEDSAITSNKIDFTTLPRAKFVKPTIKNIDINYQADYTQGEWTCDESGLYLIYFYQKLQGVFSQHDFVVKISKNNSWISYATIPLDWAGLSTMALTSLAVGDVIKFLSSGGLGSVPTDDGQAFIVRISN